MQRGPGSAQLEPLPIRLAKLSDAIGFLPAAASSLASDLRLDAEVLRPAIQRSWRRPPKVGNHGRAHARFAGPGQETGPRGQA
jgi:hypothetical protein